MNESELWETAVRRVTLAAGSAAPIWLARHGLAGRPPAVPHPAHRTAHILEVARTIAFHGRLLEAGLAAGREPDWFLHPGRGLRMREIHDLAVQLLSPVDWDVLRTCASPGETRREMALALNLVCKTLDIPLGAVALDRLALYAWTPQPAGRYMNLLLKPGRKPGRLERWLTRRRL